MINPFDRKSGRCHSTPPYVKTESPRAEPQEVTRTQLIRFHRVEYS